MHYIPYISLGLSLCAFGFAIYVDRQLGKMLEKLDKK
jgi:hypothetical protein